MIINPTPVNIPNKEELDFFDKTSSTPRDHGVPFGQPSIWERTTRIIEAIRDIPIECFMTSERKKRFRSNQVSPRQSGSSPTRYCSESFSNYSSIWKGTTRIIGTIQVTPEASAEPTPNKIGNVRNSVPELHEAPAGLQFWERSFRYNRAARIRTNGP